MNDKTVNAAEIRSEQRGPHWVAWILDEREKPKGSVIVVGQTRAEAERRARHWHEQQA